jgi:cell division protein FtsB
MLEFQAKKKVRKIFFSKAVIVIMILIVMLMTRATWNVFQKEQVSAANTREAERGLIKLKDRQNLLTSEVSRLSTNEGIEEEIRSKYSVIKPGENMLVIIDQNASTTHAQAARQSWWDSFKNLFK